MRERTRHPQGARLRSKLLLLDTSSVSLGERQALNPWYDWARGHFRGGKFGVFLGVRMLECELLSADLTEGLERAILIATIKRVGSKLRADKTESTQVPTFAGEGPRCCAHLSV